jgi:WS/DGAT/MGAT family acyltransferase
MPRYAYERLSAQDNSFLLMEQPNVHMHVAATQIYEAGPLRTAEGGIDVDAFKRAIESVLHLIPRYRQKLQWIPFENHPVWVDDWRFNLGYHIRHTSLPRPGTDTQLKQLAARIMAQQLDRTKPLWEFWVVEGLQGDRFAVISKVHHCMIDGESGAELMQVMMSVTPEHSAPEPVSYIPRPAPSSFELWRDEWNRRLNLPLAMTRSLRAFNRQTEDMRQEIVTRAQALAELLGYAISAPSETPLNGRIGPHRRVDWLSMPLDDVKVVRRALGCTVNDIVLATVTGAVREYMTRRRVNPDVLDFRVSAPVSVRREEERSALGNRVSSWILRLPLAEADPLKRVEKIRHVTQALKRSQQALGVEMLMAAAEWAPAQLLSLGSRATSGPINMIVTNVPGPQIPLYTLGARLVEMFPQVPLLENTGLCVALVSYDGRLFWGFNADPEMVPDLPNFARAITSSFVALRDAARLHPVAVRSTEPATPAETAAKARKARRQRPRPAGGRDTRAAS